MNPFDPKSLDELPDILPVFPLLGATLLPRTLLPLNIFEPRYLNMILDAFAQDRLIGMLQPDEGKAGHDPVVTFAVGCVGRITVFNEIDDGRLLIHLHGVCRFRIKKEMALHHGYRTMAVDWSEYAADLNPDPDFVLPSGNFKQTLEHYLKVNGIRIDWHALEEKPAPYIVDFLAMNLPFSGEEKQALLEARDTTQRCQTLEAIMRMAVVADVDSGTTRH